jgi:crotonobetainyl-CoA:carnitine CoA-transferase CaiB-like acyl-CoA transferase
MRCDCQPTRRLRNAAPALGRHTLELLRKLGLDDTRIAELENSGVV